MTGVQTCALPIYYGGATGGAYGGPHYLNYAKRTVAHNCMLVYDPNEEFVERKSFFQNDGGQKFINGNREPTSMEQLLRDYRSAEVLGQGFGPDPQKPAYTYLKGDFTKTYCARCVRRNARLCFSTSRANPLRPRWWFSTG